MWLRSALTAAWHATPRPGTDQVALLDPDERRWVALHESGHAIVARFTPAAERMLLRCVSSSSESDLRTAIDVPFGMVANYGMSTRVGPLFHAQHVEHPLLRQRLATETAVSDETSDAIEDDACRVRQAAFDGAKHVPEDHREAHSLPVAALLSQETLEETERKRLLPSRERADGRGHAPVGSDGPVRPLA